MSELPEMIGSMPSKPEQKLSPQKPRSNNVGIAVGFFLCVACLLVFPRYANIDELSTGVFYGMGFILLFIAIVSLLSDFSRGRGSKSGATDSRTTRTRSRKRWGFYVLLVLFLGGLFLLTSPTGTILLLVAGLMVLLIGAMVLYRVISRRVRKNKPLEVANIGVKSTPSLQKSASTSLERGAGFLLSGLFSLVLPKMMNATGFVAGIFYGMGLIISLMAIIGLCSVISKRLGDKALSGR